MPSLSSVASAVGLFALVVALYAASIYLAYDIRLWAIKIYGRVIHEFDPWFNFRATQYLADNGVEKFFKWFDHMSWYPLGRPVGTTIYPGMQLVAVYLWDALKWKGWRQIFGVSLKMSLNDVCVFIPAWFGAVASVCVGLLAREVSGSRLAGAFAAVVMAVVPAHLMRSIGGGYDNESVAVTAMSLTFYLWCRSLRTSSSWPIGLLAGAAYGFMAAAWGGYIFVGNMVGLHAGWLVLLGHFTPSLHKAYSLWYMVGTLIAVQVPVIGYAPYRSLEQALPLLVFLGMHLLALTDRVISTRLGVSLTDRKDRWRVLRYRVLTFATVGGICLSVLIAGMALGLFGGLSVRVKSLFVKHTRTGNPLVDSVAEHQPASTEAYKQYLHHTYALAPLGMLILLFRGASNPVRSDFGIPVTKWFLILYAVVGYYFSARMARLIILLGPVASGLAGVAIDGLANWSLAQIESGFGAVQELVTGKKAAPAAAAPAPAAAEDKAADDKATTTPSKGKAGASSAAPSTPSASSAAAAEGHVLDLYGLGFLAPGFDTFAGLYRNPITRVIRLMIAGLVIYTAPTAATQFYGYCQDFSKRISQPSLMFQARLNNGQEVMVNDYQEAYWWLRDNTPEDSRVLSWWDYGYQIAGIANRTTLADGNTWSLEHIALLGRILTAPEKNAHDLAKHLADYVLVWAGNSGDDLAKSPHMARIGSSVFPDICPRDPLCRNFGFYADRRPTPSMAASLLYKLHSANLVQGVTVDPALFQHVYTSKYGLVRIYKVMNIDEDSRKWAADPSNRLCDAPGSWYCPGQYPPNLPINIPKSHRHVNYDNPDMYVEEEEARARGDRSSGSSGGKKAGKKAKKEAGEKKEKPASGGFQEEL